MAAHQLAKRLIRKLAECIDVRIAFYKYLKIHFKRDFN